LLAYTDGLPDIQDQQEIFGDERTQETVKTVWSQPAQSVLDTLISKLVSFSAGQPQSDDITLIVLSREEVVETAAPTREVPVQITFRGRQRVF
jgi:sigma-B regulation protein RsbU (phosphoserine phosphatase)